ncbi:hypothetical protein H2200_012157 [Cladophialophora chaetospira]|uniref:DNA (cytosine-5-)-methyltransferase n=1 Tax=Cladophialophora chaetospira TaxID=386627 RepID=A0AA39CCM1_9EURO|nr:hypothetical protein H2200_012157 [Cladophialophora chaetospira]
MKDYGVPQQKRLRLIVIASGPGESILPRFPEPTHGPGRLYPYMNIGDALKDIPKGTPGMEIGGKRPTKGEAYPNTKFAKAIRSSSQQCHPDGGRTFNGREIARLQGFPDEYTFDGSVKDVRLLIGNAVPVTFAKTMMRWLRGSVEEADYYEAALEAQMYQA